MLVVQDGRKRMPEQTQNFVRAWAEVARPWPALKRCHQSVTTA